MVGSVPGMIITRSTFGFMALLGVFALAGTVIHNGIFLIDFIDHRRHDGVPLDEAITEGIQRRTRPIILTAVATIVELIPMTLSRSTLWPPFAWVIITGLSVSTLMTLLVIPSVFKLTFRHEAAHAKTR
jgi:multidrug efflux pump subunit AcrB